MMNLESKQPEVSGFFPITPELKQGDVGIVRLVGLDTGQPLVEKSVGREDLIELIDYVQREYSGVGFLNSDVDLSFRLPTQQAEHALRLRAIGVNAVQIEAMDSGTVMIMPYVQGERLIDQVSAGKLVGVNPALESLYIAHRGGMVIGDRWPFNIIADEDGNITHIDFDIEINGKLAPEFEVSQLIYGLLSRTSTFSQAADIASSFVLRHGLEYDRTSIVRFMKAYEQQLTDYPKKTVPVIGARLGIFTDSIA